jgi:hypothetical protein
MQNIYQAPVFYHRARDDVELFALDHAGAQDCLQIAYAGPSVSDCAPGNAAGQIHHPADGHECQRQRG